MTGLLSTDILVVGSGIAGLWFALRASRLGRVLVITKKSDVESATNYAQGGIAAATAENDAPGLHASDTLATGAGLAHPAIVRLVTETGPALVRELYETGVRFSTYVDARGREQFDLGQEGGHHRRRIVHAADRTGLEIERGLVRAVKSSGRVSLSEEHFAAELLLDDSGRCVGCQMLSTDSGEPIVVRARVVMLATGGIGQAYRHTTNPRIATGDGIAMGFRAGARVANMEFIQFHPTSLYGSDINGRAFLISEAVRGEGAILRTRDGEPFMSRYHPDASLAPRDIVARAADAEMKSRGEDYVLLDATHLAPELIRQRFPTIHQTCLESGIDMTKDPIPVVPAAHYVCGGLEVNEWSETTVSGLLAAGECACTGLHGANRLASNSLLEALVFAERAADHLVEAGIPGEPGDVAVPSLLPEDGAAVRQAGALREELQGLMWQHAGIVRTDDGLRYAGDRLAELCEQTSSLGRAASVRCRETVNLLEVARLVVTSARLRPESRGLHYNQDHPQMDPGFARDTIVDRARIA